MCFGDTCSSSVLTLIITQRTFRITAVEKTTKHTDRIYEILQSPDPGAFQYEGEKIIESWKRCLETHRLEPHSTKAPEILTSTELEDVRNQIEQFINIAKPELIRLHQMLSGNNYFVLLTNADGVCVDFRCSPALESIVKDFKLYPGSLWPEYMQGTNGAALCIDTGSPVSIVMDEHFSSRYTSLTCTVAPIFDEHGTLIAALDVTTSHTTDHQAQVLIRNIVVNAAKRIEKNYFHHIFNDDIIIRLSCFHDFSELASVGLLALDDNEKIIAASDGTMEFLGINDREKLLKKPVEEILGIPLEQCIQPARPSSNPPPPPPPPTLIDILSPYSLTVICLLTRAKIVYLLAI